MVAEVGRKLDISDGVEGIDSGCAASAVGESDASTLEHGNVSNSCRFPPWENGETPEAESGLEIIGTSSPQSARVSDVWIWEWEDFDISSVAV